MSITLRPADGEHPYSSLRTPLLHRLASKALTSLGMRNQLGARALESAWMEPATWVWSYRETVPDKVENTQSCHLADMSRSLALGGRRDLDRVALGQPHVTRSLSNDSVDLDH
jgi:hypothetical protein